MKHGSRIACIILSLAVFTMLFFMSSPASAATHTLSAVKLAASVNTTCIHDHQCAGQDPYSDGCAGGNTHWGVLLSAYMRDSSNTIIGYVQLWYSNTCDTNWAHTYNYFPNNGYTNVAIGNYGGSTLDNLTCNSRLPNCQDIRTFQYWIPGPAIASGNVNGIRNAVHQ